MESLLLRVLHTGDVSVDSIAAALAVSRQTLFRRLKAEGITFERVLDDLRRKRRSILSTQVVSQWKIDSAAPSVFVVLGDAL